MINRKLNIGVGPPLKRFIDGIIFWREERVFGKWLKQLKAVHKHNKAQRKLNRWLRKERKQEFVRWRDEDPAMTLEEKMREL